MMKTGRPPWAIFKIDPHAAGASPSDDENGPPALGVIFKIDSHAAGASPSDDENGPPALGVIFKIGANVVFCTTKTGG